MTKEELQIIVTELSYKADITLIPTVVIVDSENLASTDFVNIMISETLALHPDRYVIEGALAHELAHIALKHNKPQYNPWLISTLIRFFLPFLIAVPLMAYLEDEPMAQALSIPWSIGLSILVGALVGPAISRHIEYAADKLAVDLVGKTKVIKALKFCTSYRPNNFSLFSTHPSDASRFKAVNKIKVHHR